MPKPYKKGGRGGGGVAKAVRHALPCRYYQRGKCSNPNCPYLHVKEKGSGGGGGAGGTITPSGVAPDADVTLTMLKLFFEKHQHSIYNAEARMLDLTALATKEELASIASSVNFNNRSFCLALCQCITSCIVPPPAIVALAQNGISSLHHLARAMEETGMHQTLQAVSLAMNDIQTCDFAKELKNFTSLVELNMLGNPAAELADYKQRVKKSLPFLLLLDTAPLLAPPLALPWPIFYRVDETRGGPPTDGAVVPAYDTVQRDILQFIQTAVLNPLEQEPGPAASGTVTGVDAVSEAYSLNACLSITLSCPEAAVATPPVSSSSSSGASGGVGLRGMVREIVGLRIRQTESDHNLLHGSGKGSGAKVAQVATGRTQVCAQLEHWLYPRPFSVGHYIHASPDVAVLDNNGMGPSAPTSFKEPISVVTLHGVMVWRFRRDGPTTTGAGAAAPLGSVADRGLVVIKRNFSRVLTVAVTGQDSRWQIVNDMVSLYPFRGSAPEDDADVAAAAAALHQVAAGESNKGQLRGTGPSLEGSLLADLNPYDVVFSPAIDPKRVSATARQFQVPVSVVAIVVRGVSSDAEMAAVLSDVQGTPLDVFESCAACAGGDAMAGILLCRLQRKYGVDPASAGLQLLSQHGLDWDAVQRAAVGPPQQ